MEERLLESVPKGTVLVDTSTARASDRLNGLAVIGMADYSFGHPVRITATSGPGDAA